MKRKGLVLIGLVAGLMAANATVVGASGPDSLEQVRAATARFQQVAAAQANGYGLVSGLDYCFDNPGVGGMGYHYIQASSLDLKLDALRPEAMVYAPDRDGKLKLEAVEYIVPAADWDAASNIDPPSVLGHSLHLNQALGVYVLHAWIWQQNPAGMFEDWNPEVSCPVTSYWEQIPFPVQENEAHGGIDSGCIPSNLRRVIPNTCFRSQLDPSAAR
jgi:hypothetical protein